MRFRDIPPFTRSPNYRVDVPWSSVEDQLKSYERDACVFRQTFEIDPDFQRGHVWDRTKQIRYVEYVLRKGVGARDIFFNSPGWMQQEVAGGRFVLVDGKQRLEAVRSFLRGEFPACGGFYSDFTDRLPHEASFVFRINDLPDDAAVLRWYLDLNSGGVAHSQEELDRVATMLAQVSSNTIQHE